MLNIQLKNIAILLVIGIVVAVVGIASYVVFTSPPSQNINPRPTAPIKVPPPASEVPVTPPVPTTPPAVSIDYDNAQYGFIFTLPSTWKGYTVVSETWEGNFVDGQSGKTVTGPKILIRHPLWTTQNPRQDIPIMVFTLAQWDLITKEKLAVGAAPIQPSELGHNAKYVFALPARYNYAFQTGFEEVERIFEGKPLQAY